MVERMNFLLSELRSLSPLELNLASTAVVATPGSPRFFLWELLQAFSWVPTDAHLPAPRLLPYENSPASPVAEAGFVELQTALLDLFSHDRLRELELPARAVLICALYCAGRRARLSAHRVEAGGVGGGHPPPAQLGARQHAHGHGHGHRPGHHHAHVAGHHSGGHGSRHGQLQFRRSLSPRFAGAIACVLLGTSGSDLSRLKDAITVCGATDLFELIHRDLETACPGLGLQLLQHFAAEAALLRAAHHMPLGVQVISDVDDTLISGWLESRYTRGQAIPGIVAFVKALRNHAHTGSAQASVGSAATLRLKPLLAPNWWLAEQSLPQPDATSSAFSSLPLEGSSPGHLQPSTVTPVRVDDVDLADAAFAPPASVVRRLLARLRNRRVGMPVSGSASAPTGLAGSTRGPPVSVSAIQDDNLEALARELEAIALAAAAKVPGPATDRKADVPADCSAEQANEKLLRSNDGVSQHASVVGTTDATSQEQDSSSQQSSKRFAGRQVPAFSGSGGFSEEGGNGSEPAALQLLESLPSPMSVAFDAKRKRLRALANADSGPGLGGPGLQQQAAAGSVAVHSGGPAQALHDAGADDSDWGHDGQFPSSIFLVTARPADLRGLLKRRTLESVSFLPLRCHVLALLGSLRSSTSTSAIVSKKVDNAMRAAALFPELDLVLLGDSGQGDAAVYAHVIRRLSGGAIGCTDATAERSLHNGSRSVARQRAYAFLHHVNPQLASAEPPAVSGDGAYVSTTYPSCSSQEAQMSGFHICGTWAEAARAAAEAGLISSVAANEVASASLRQFEEQLVKAQAEQHAQRQEQLQLQLEREKQGGKRRSLLNLRLRVTSRLRPSHRDAQAAAVTSDSADEQKPGPGPGLGPGPEPADASGLNRSLRLAESELAPAQLAILNQLRQLVSGTQM